jgi:hypothetical protein
MALEYGMDAGELIDRLAKREHHFRNAIEGEYDANLLQVARLVIEDLVKPTSPGIPVYASRDATDDVLGKDGA